MKETSCVILLKESVVLAGLNANKAPSTGFLLRVSVVCGTLKTARKLCVAVLILPKPVTIGPLLKLNEKGIALVSRNTLVLIRVNM